MEEQGHALPRLLTIAALVLYAVLQPALAKPRKAPVLPDNAPDAVTYGQRDDVMRFANEAAERHALDETWVRSALSQSRFIPSVVKYIMPPPAGTAKNWIAY